MGKLGQRMMLTMDTTDMPDLMPMVTDLWIPICCWICRICLWSLPICLWCLLRKDLLMLSQRLMPTTDTMDMPDLMPMDMLHMLMVLMEVTGDKLNATQLRSSKANIKYQ